jgi:hypothetical protein
MESELSVQSSQDTNSYTLPFLRLPLELREMIYSYLLPRSTVKVQRIRSRAKKDGWKNNGILAVNKQISVEALQVLYRQNLFIIPICYGTESQANPDPSEPADSRTSLVTELKGLVYPGLDEALAISTNTLETLGSFGTANLERIRHVQLVACEVTYFQLCMIVHMLTLRETELKMEPYLQNIQIVRRRSYIRDLSGLHYPNLDFDPKIWRPLLEKLTRLSLVLHSPLQMTILCQRLYPVPDSFRPPGYTKKRVQPWLEWLGPMLQYLAQNITDTAEKTTRVSIDENNELGTGELLEKYFTVGYDRIHTETGDVLFGRGGQDQDGAYKGLSMV